MELLIFDRHDAAKTLIGLAYRSTPFKVFT